MNITEEIKRLADKEREVRKLEMLIEHIASLSDEDLAIRSWRPLLRRASIRLPMQRLLPAQR